MMIVDAKDLFDYTVAQFADAHRATVSEDQTERAKALGRMEVCNAILAYINHKMDSHLNLPTPYRPPVRNTRVDADELREFVGDDRAQELINTGL